MGSDPHSAYKSTQVETAAPEQILLMLYEGAIKYMKQAKEALEDNNHQLSHEKLLKAQDIVTELMASLDMEIGGEIAQDLHLIYDYVLNNLVEANVEKSPRKVQQVIPIMENLYDSWDEIINEQGMTLEKAREQHDGELPDMEKVSSPGASEGGQDSPSRPQQQAQTSQSPPSQPGSPRPDIQEAADPDKDSQSKSDQSNQDVTYGDFSIQG
ncbi:MAG: flagellar export chaperone FliS [bacterium]